MAFNIEDLKFKSALKAYTALLGAVVTALLSSQAPGSVLFTVLATLSAVLTAAGTWAASNTPSTVVVDDAADDDGQEHLFD